MKGFENVARVERMNEERVTKKYIMVLWREERIEAGPTRVFWTGSKLPMFSSITRREECKRKLHQLKKAEKKNFINGVKASLILKNVTEYTSDATGVAT